MERSKIHRSYEDVEKHMYRACYHLQVKTNYCGCWVKGMDPACDERGKGKQLVGILGKHSDKVTVDPSVGNVQVVEDRWSVVKRRE
ncbi:hypothetical protein GYH30_001331 [Glycine max]|uniref:Uncharacterized protein n=1 Tax=Glycine max TaxID=3847 RepID=A0A0R0LFP3_SOYBN|nr:hypothetical protein JHK86_001503 [Glycine max]KAH1162781.1 hypothetical protein GYH30_001331 [Glycine max]